MFDTVRTNPKVQLPLGFCMGIIFGFLLQRGGVTRYELILGQLLLKNWTVAKVMLTAVLVGMPGIYLMHARGWVSFHRKSGSVGATVIGGLIFGVGFAVLGYCPGTMAGAAAQGSMDALFGGIVGMLIGTSVFAAIYPKLKEGILQKGAFGDITFPELFKCRPLIAVPVAMALIALCLIVLERMGY